MALISQTALGSPRYDGPAWHRDALGQIASRLTKPTDFPCVFSQNAFQRELLRFIFVPSLSETSIRRSAADLADYVALSRRWNGKINTAEPLVVVFSEQVLANGTLKQYHDVGWSLLQRWHELDPEAWPEEVATDPHSPYWSMCFGGMQLFVNMSNPAHRVRRSRNLGSRLLFIINPRERFDLVAGETPEGRRVRQRIRSRVERYDGVGHCHQLGSFQAGEIEWWQYGIIEENRERHDRCRFRQRADVREPLSET